MLLPSRKVPKGRIHNKTKGLLTFSDYKKKRNVATYIGFIVILIMFVILALAPIVWLLVSSFKTVSEINSVDYHFFPNSLDFSQFIELWEIAGLTDVFINTFVVVIGAVICAVIFNSILAYVIAIIKPIGYKVLDKMILLAYMIPSALAIYPLMLAISNTFPHGSYLPLFLVFGSNAYYYMLFKNYFEKFPKSVIEASRIDGLNNLKIFFKVVLPLSRSIIGVVAIFAMTAAYSDFLLPYMVIGQGSDQRTWTLMVAIYNLSSDTNIKANQLLQLLVLSIIPQIIIFVIFQKQITNQSVNSGMKE